MPVSVIRAILAIKATGMALSTSTIRSSSGRLTTRAMPVDKATNVISMLRPLQASITPIRAPFNWITLPSENAVKPRVWSVRVLARVASDWSGGPSSFSIRQGRAIMKNRNMIEGNDHRNAGHPPNIRATPAQ